MVHCIKLWANVDNELKFEFLMWLEETAKCYQNTTILHRARAVSSPSLSSLYIYSWKPVLLSSFFLLRYQITVFYLHL